jgi:hypothetical protein
MLIAGIFETFCQMMQALFTWSDTLIHLWSRIIRGASGPERDSLPWLMILFRDKETSLGLRLSDEWISSRPTAQQENMSVVWLAHERTDTVLFLCILKDSITR